MLCVIFFNLGMTAVTVRNGRRIVKRAGMMM
jgi:hypothetical protein